MPAWQQAAGGAALAGGTVTVRLDALAGGTARWVSAGRAVRRTLVQVGRLLQRWFVATTPQARVLAAPFPSFIEVEPRLAYTVITRIYNVIIAALGLLLLSPLLLALAVLIKLTSPGPVLYRGERVGLGERIYTIYKLRTMNVGAEAAIGARLVGQEEGHFTRIGRFLRRYRLDELPQLFNVLKGDMNLVGPRPLRPIFLEEHKRTIPGYAKRFTVRPGITGKAQVRGGYYTSPRAKLRYDMLYIAHRSVGLDLKLIALTFIRVMTRIFTTGFILAWLVGALLILPRQAREAFDVVIGHTSFSLLYLVPVLAAIWLLVRREVSDRRLYLLRTPLDLPLVLFVAFALLSVAFSHNPMTSFRGALYYIVTGATVYYLVANSGVVTRQWLQAAWLIGSLATVIALAGLLELTAAWRFGPGLLGADGSLYRLRSTLGNTLAVAALLILSLPLLLSLFLTEARPLRRAAWGLSAGVVLLTVLLTFTRTALLGTFVALWLFLKGRHRRLLVVLGLVMALGAYALSGTSDQRLHPGSALEQAGREIQRQGELLAAFSGKRLVVGVGARTLPAFLAAQGQSVGGRTPVFENIYLTLLVEHGILGFGCFALLLGTALTRMRRAAEVIPDEQRRCVVRAVSSGLAGFLILLLAFDGLRILPLEVLLWATLGYGVGLSLHSAPGPLGYYRVVHFRDKL